jgi:4-phytase/acid phosphatase
MVIPMQERNAMPPPIRCALGAGLLALCGLLAACAGSPERPAPDAQSAPVLERVVMLMRHGVRPPTKPQVAPEGMADREWPTWSTGFGELTQHGYDAVRLVGAWDRTHWAARGLIPTDGCPSQDTVAVAASAKSRTQDTARALLEGLAPGCGIAVAFPAGADEDFEFHPLETGYTRVEPDQAVRAVAALAPPGGMDAEVQARAALFAQLNQALGCCAPPLCEAWGVPAGCDLSQMPTGIVRHEDDRPDVGDPFGLASTISQTFLLQYLEGMPMQDVAWGRLDRDGIEALLEFHSIKFRYEGRAPYVAARAASPLAARMLAAVEDGPPLTVLVGHDTNIADLGGLLDLHWTVPGYPRDDPPPGGALGFEVLSDARGERFVRAFYRSQTMDQVRELQPLSDANAPAYVSLPIPGCAQPCRLDDFAALVRGKLVAPVAAAAR